MQNIKFIIPRMPGDESKYKSLVEPSLKKIQVQALNVFDNPGVTENIFKKYNSGIEAALKGGLNDDDIIVFSHNDVAILDNIFRDKVQLLFQEKKDIGLVGIAGAIELSERGGWWMTTPDKMRGHLIQGNNQEKVGEGFHLVKGAIGYFDDLVCIDGCLMMTTGKLIKEGLCFDDKTYFDSDFYDIDFCLNVLERGYKIAVADILVYHQSTGMGSLKEPWKNAKELLFKKWTDKGYKLPFTRDQFKIKEEINEIVEVEI